MAVQLPAAAASATLLGLVWGGGIPARTAITVASVAFATHAVWTIASWKRFTGHMLDAYTLFLLALQLFNGGQLALYLLGLLPDGILDGAFDPDTLGRAAALVLACVVWFHLGALVHALRPLGDRRRESAPEVRALRRVGIVYLGIGVPSAFLSMVTSVRLAASEGYMALYQQQQRTGWGNWQAVIAGFAIPGAIILAATATRTRTVAVAWIVTVAYSVLTLFMGARAAAAMALLPMLLVHHRAIRPLRPIFVVSLSMLALVGLPMIAALRNLAASDRAEALSSARREMSPAVALVKEMGNSMQTVAYSLKFVPDEREHDWGVGYLRAATTAMPNLFWTRHPFAEVGSYSQWLVWRADPLTASLGGGLGFSMIAEAYVNGSAAGALLIMLIAGALLARAVTAARRRAGAVAVAAEALILGALLALPRGESADVVRPLIWNVLLPLGAAALARFAEVTRLRGSSIQHGGR